MILDCIQCGAPNVLNPGVVKRQRFVDACLDCRLASEAKKCQGCGDSKAFEEFNPHTRARDGRASRCRRCLNPSGPKRDLTFAQCGRCGEVKEPRDFHENKRRKGGLAIWCKPCVSGYRREWRYGLTPEELEELLGRGCQACGATTDLVVDHDHPTGRVRGCLCGGCNTALGLLGENPARMAGLAQYAEAHCG